MTGSLGSSGSFPASNLKTAIFSLALVPFSENNLRRLKILKFFYLLPKVISEILLLHRMKNQTNKGLMQVLSSNKPTNLTSIL